MLLHASAVQDVVGFAAVSAGRSPRELCFLRKLSNTAPFSRKIFSSLRSDAPALFRTCKVGSADVDWLSAPEYAELVGALALPQLANSSSSFSSASLRGEKPYAWADI